MCNYPTGFYIDSSATANPTVAFEVNRPHTGYTYTWDFGDGGSSSDTDAVHTYTSGSTFTVCLTASDAVTGCSTQSCQPVSVELCGIAAQIATNINANLTVLFRANTNHVGAPYTYDWSFPEATPTSSDHDTITVTYPDYGTYEVCLRITTTGGCTDTICKSFTINRPQYYIWGHVYKGSADPCATVYLIKEDTTGHLALVDSTVMYDSTGLGNCYGYYGFYQVPAGIYYVKASLQSTDPDYADYLPTYYENVLGWGDATPVDLTNGPLNINIHLLAGNNLGGPGFIGGYVVEGAGLVAGGGGGSSGGRDEARSTEDAGDPLAHIQINLLTSGDLPVAYTYTDGSGHYQFNNLAYGTYKIYAEQLNKVPTAASVTLTAAQPSSSNVNIMINSTDAVAGVEDLDNIVMNSIYPNPVLSQLELQLNVKQAANATLKLIDMMGRTELERIEKLSGGNNSLQIDMIGLAAGVYQLVIQCNDKRITYRVAKAK